MKVITISREFGSGGRELGKRLADLLGYAYYDKEIEAEIARRMDMDPGYIARHIDQGTIVNVRLHFGRTIASGDLLKQQINILVEKQRLLKELASASNCVIVGRAADSILEEYGPFNLFVYADMKHRIERCQKYGREGENLSNSGLEKAIKKIDSQRAEYRKMFTGKDWGDIESYHLCINTAGVEVKKIVPHVAEYAKSWFEGKSE